MISIKKGNIFASNCDCIVNTINCVGFMGKGIALEISIRYPEIEPVYKKMCESNQIEIGTLWLYDPKDASQKVLNFPTKIDYKYPSKIEYLERGLNTFRKEYKSYGIKSIAFPMLGAQNGKISFDESLNIMKKYLSDISDLDIEIYTFDKENYERDKLFVDFMKYVEENKSDPKNERIYSILSERNDIYTFADITEKKISEEKPTGEIQKKSIATRQYLQKIISNIKNKNNTAQASFFEQLESK